MSKKSRKRSLQKSYEDDKKKNDVQAVKKKKNNNETITITKTASQIEAIDEGKNERS